MQKNTLLIDWFSFSIRKDAKSPVVFSGELDFPFICGLLGVPEDEFTEIGKVPYYETMYRAQNITIKVPFAEKQDRQGFNVSLSGQGCRYLESLHKDGEFCDSLTVWRDLGRRLRDLTKQGLAVNITRLDVAMDDFVGCLDLDKIWQCVLDGRCVSRFRYREIDVCNQRRYESQEVTFKQSLVQNMLGKTIYFGRTTGKSFCRIYDKKVEQLQKVLDKQTREEVTQLSHWVRCEFVLKDKLAIAILNALIDEKDFRQFWAEYVNGMLRFVELDDCNRTRCSMQDWWSAFIGTLRRCSLSLPKYMSLTVDRFLNRTYHQFSGVIYTAICCDGLDNVLLNCISKAKSGKLSKKHQDLCGGIETNARELCSAQLWEILKPAGSKSA